MRQKYVWRKVAVDGSTAFFRPDWVGHIVCPARSPRICGRRHYALVHHFDSTKLFNALASAKDRRRAALTATTPATVGSIRRTIVSSTSPKLAVPVASTNAPQMHQKSRRRVVRVAFRLPYPSLVHYVTCIDRKTYLSFKVRRRELAQASSMLSRAQKPE